MNIGAGIYGILSNDSTLTGMLSSTTAIYQDAAPQRTPNPCIVYSESTGEFSDTKDGVSHLDISVVQVDVYSATISARALITERVRALMDRFSGTSNGVQIQSMKLIFSLPTIEPYNDEGDKRIYRQSMDFQVRQKN